VKRVLKQLETFAPGLTKLHVGTERSEAPFSYSGALRPGESKTLRINENPNPRWITIGEASGGAFQGYLEGAFSSSDEAVKRLIPREKYLSAVCSDLVI
jgi:monoamine oxidase